MKILEINIIQFGKLKDRSFTLSDGFNVVKGDNESGKSTLLAFIKFALYGVGRKNPNVAVGERERALSWNVGVAAGSLTLEDTDGKRYRVERNGKEGARGSYSDKCKIIDLQSGEEAFSGEIPGERFLGINAQAYDSMCNIKQLEAVSVGADAVREVIDNLLSSGDENTSVQAATKALDAERRRLLHANGRGGLVYESETALERLKAEYKGATVSENERIKNHDELQRVELALTRAKSEFDVAQRMCDLHDDAQRLRKFEELSVLKGKVSELQAHSRELDGSAGFDISCADYSLAAKAQNAAEMLESSLTSLCSAKKELEETQNALSKIACDNSSGFAEIIEEFNNPNAALAHLSVKKKKKSSSALRLALLGVACAVLLAFAAALAFAMQNVSGAATVAFIGIILGALALASYKRLSRARAEIDAFMKKMGDGFCSKNEEKILIALEKYYESSSERTRLSNAKESAKFRFNVANDTYGAHLSSAKDVARELNVVCSDTEIGDELLKISKLICDYLAKRNVLDGEIKENNALLRSLSSELERFSERDIRARISPEIRERILNVPFEKLKADRDAALYKTNQFSQYKAGIERSLAAVGKGRSAADIFPEIEAETERLASLKLRLEAVKLAADTVNEASSALKSDVTPRIRASAEANLSSMTSGKYSELLINENMELSVFADGATRPIASLSKGSLDAAYFALRLALLQSLLADKQPPIYMDETLSQLDDGRAENALKLASEYSRSSQCVLFTCQERDLTLARKITDINLIEL